MPGYRDLARDREFRALLVAHVVSVAGDQFARVALTVHVYDRTASAGLTAMTYALTFLPDLLGGPLLSGLADRFARRPVMVAADLVRAVLLLFMAVPGLPLWALASLLVLVQFAGAPHGAARAALLPQILPDERYPMGQAVLSTVTQAAQVAGFLTGGALVAWLGAGLVLVADGLTFAVSAVLVGAFLLHRPAPRHPHVRAWPADLIGGARLVWGDRRLRALVALACVSGFYIAGEALAAPLAAQLGAGPAAVGAIFGVVSAGTAVGMVLLARLPRERGLRWMPLLSVLSCAVLLPMALTPGLGWSLVLLGLSGAASGYQLLANATFVRSVPDATRGQAFGLAVTALRVSQGVGIAAAGAAAQWWPVHHVIAATAGLGTLVAAGAAWEWKQAAGRSVPRF
ncbi:Predicted arabinose efflux permease, MFS family [Lentzea albidocapillata subsp. violacea]|uniref:Predicted arabinose efflux permease, MFS family n=1 Tax=Lentzea albidocapillata subsp. violacea TaxID=128104 RepID=A0A1G8RNL7_9PSEU|nr:MFS transporter [Lentzea albidocapillata]SDJ17980.1 Predicted arabinose efflux permease, MFS family [Lentzea albidocapillata subsp. violacea]